MDMFRTKSREEKIINHLVGSGLFSSVPVNDVAFYSLAASCASSSWFRRCVGGVRPISDAEERRLNLSDRQSTEPNQPVELSVVQGQGDNTANNDARGKIFKPKASLPFPLFQQTFRKWKSSMDMELRFRRLRKLRASIVLQPLDEFPSFLADFHVHLRDRGHFGFFELLQEFMKVFFTGANICLNSKNGTSAWDVTSRVHESTGKQQLLATDLNQHLSKSCLPLDAYGVVGITWTDLFPNDKENFVLGKSDPEQHSAVVSFGRFDTNQAQYEDVSQVDDNLIWKMIKVLSHETCHLFYMSHCVFFECLMNQSRSVAEAMSQPLYLCPVCMRKLQKVLRFPSVVQYMKNMLKFLHQLADAGLANQQLINTAVWLERCISVTDTQADADKQ